MQDAIAHFAIRLICGIGLALCAMPRKEVAAPFFRIMLLVVLGLGALFSLMAQGGAVWRGAAICAVAFAGTVCWLIERRQAGTVAITAVFMLATVEVVFVQGGRPESGTGRHWLDAASALATSATLGAALTGMLLGHRYLTAPGMPLAPLIWLNAGLGLAAVLRFAVSAIALSSGYGALPQSTYSLCMALPRPPGLPTPLPASFPP